MLAGLRMLARDDMPIRHEKRVRKGGSKRSQSPSKALCRRTEAPTGASKGNVGRLLRWGSPLTSTGRSGRAAAMYPARSPPISRWAASRGRALLRGHRFRVRGRQALCGNDRRQNEQATENLERSAWNDRQQARQQAGRKDRERHASIADTQSPALLALLDRRCNSRKQRNEGEDV